MRIKNAIMTVLALALSLCALLGMTYSEHYQRAASVESAGFDALAHDLFDGGKTAGNGAERSLH